MIKDKLSVLYEYLKFKGLLKKSLGRQPDNVFDAMRYLFRNSEVKVPLDLLDTLKVFEYTTGTIAWDIAFSDKGNIAVAPSASPDLRVLDPNGNLLNKVGDGYHYPERVSYCCGRFASTTTNSYVYVTDEDGNLLKKIQIGEEYSDCITLFDNGFIACDRSCARFDFTEELDIIMRWNIELGIVSDNPIIYKDYVYVPIDGIFILRFSDGDLVKIIDCDKEQRESCRSIAICGNRLAAITYHRLYFYDLSDPIQPRELWSTGGITDGKRVTFSPDCKYIAVADHNVGILVFDSNGNKIFEGSRWGAASIAWWKDRLAVGLHEWKNKLILWPKRDEDILYVYNVKDPDKINELLTNLPFNLVLDRIENKFILL